MSDLIVREITKEDIISDADLISTAFEPVSKLHGLPSGQDLSPIISRLEEDFKQETRQFGAWEDNKLVGYFSLTLKDEEIFEISRLCVHPDVQRQGYGQRLLDRAVVEIRRSNGVAAVCAVIVDNSFVLSWLERNYFHTEVSGNFPGIPCPVSILQKDLPPVPGCSPGECLGCSGGCC